MTSIRLQLSLLSMVMMTSFPAVASQGDDSKAINVGIIGAAKQHLTANGDASHVLNTGDKIIFNQSIDTDATGQTQLIFMDKSTLTVGPNASVKIDKFVFDPEKSGGELAVSSTKGMLRFVGGALSKNQPVTIKTPSATIGIRGGIAVVSVGENGHTDATFLYGQKMTVQNAAGIQETTHPGMAINVKGPNTPPAPPVRVNPNILAQNNNALMGRSDGHPPAGNDGNGQNQGGDQNGNGQNGNGQNQGGDQNGNGQNGNSQNQGGDQSGNGQNGNSQNQGGDQSGNGQNGNGQNQGGDQNGNGQNGNNQNANGQNQQQGGNNPPPPNGKNPPPNGGNPPPPPAPLAGFGGNNPLPPIPPAPGTGLPLPPNGGNIIQPPPVNTTNAAQDNSQTQVTQQVNNSTDNPPPKSFDAVIDIKQPGSGGLNTIDVDGGVAIDANGNFLFKTVDTGGDILSPQRTGWAQNGTFTQSIGMLLPKAGPGYSLINIPFAKTGESSQALAYASPGGNMFYYDMFLPPNYAAQLGLSSSNPTSIAFGRRAAILPASGLFSYRFLPEMIAGGYSESPFNIAILQSNLLPATTNNLALANNPGMLVDWGAKKGLLGGIIWDNSSVDPNTGQSKSTTGFRVAISSLNPAAPDGTNAMNGIYRQFSDEMVTPAGATPTSIINNKQMEFGVERENIFGDTAGNVDGFAIESAQNAATALRQAAVATPVPAGFSLNRTSTGAGQFDTGYTAGFLTHDNGAGQTRDLVYTVQGGDMKFFRNNDPAANSAGVDMSLTAKAAPNAINVKMGTVLDLGTNTTVTYGNSALISDKYYGMTGSGTGALTYNTPMTPYSNPTNFNGALVSGGFAANQNLGCSACQFVGWGAWAGTQQVQSSVSTVTDSFNVMPYVTGRMTPDLAAQVTNSQIGSGTVVYNGGTIGSILNNSNNTISHASGAFTASINMGSRNVEAFSGNLGGYNFVKSTGAVATVAPTGGAAFTNLAIQASAGSPTLNGYVNGALFGPHAEEIGGNFNFNASNAQGAGVYLGKHP